VSFLVSEGGQQGRPRGAKAWIKYQIFVRVISMVAYRSIPTVSGREGVVALMVGILSF
jgi:hypothetical protein